jgi:hypothetical protein
MREAWKEKWVESILYHVTGGSEDHDKEYAAKWRINISWKKVGCIFYTSIRGSWIATSAAIG